MKDDKASPVRAQISLLALIDPVTEIVWLTIDGDILGIKLGACVTDGASEGIDDGDVLGLSLGYSVPIDG